MDHYINPCNVKILPLFSSSYALCFVLLLPLGLVPSLCKVRPHCYSLLSLCFITCMPNMVLWTLAALDISVQILFLSCVINLQASLCSDHYILFALLCMGYTPPPSFFPWPLWNMVACISRLKSSLGTSSISYLLTYIVHDYLHSVSPIYPRGVI